MELSTEVGLVLGIFAGFQTRAIDQSASRSEEVAIGKGVVRFENTADGSRSILDEIGSKHDDANAPRQNVGVQFCYRAVNQVLITGAPKELDARC